MKLRVPNYFIDFHCIADKCKDCCCKCWEIDIDDKTKKYYKKYKGNFSEKLKNGIDFSSPAHFILNQNQKCPFLNNQNLCEIFINLGEEHLCEICSEHPRFYEWFDGFKEGGIGLCCEEACRIILSQEEPFKVLESSIKEEDFDKYDKGLFDYLYQARENILLYLDNNSLSLSCKMQNILWYCFYLQRNIDINDYKEENIAANYPKINVNTNFEDIFNFFLTLEEFDENWKPYLKDCINIYKSHQSKLSDFENHNPQIEKYLKNISIYFIWRYFLKAAWDEDVLSKVSLMAVSIYIIKIFFYCEWQKKGTLSFDDCINIAKDYSKELEYSDINLSKFENVCYNLSCFSVPNIANLFYR